MIEQRECEWCGGIVDDGAPPCPRSFACPSCGAPPGSPCKRPSGHACQIHVGRLALAGLDAHGYRLDAEPVRLFEPAPEQIPGQLELDA